MNLDPGHMNTAAATLAAAAAGATVWCCFPAGPSHSPVRLPTNRTWLPVAVVVATLLGLALGSPRLALGIGTLLLVALAALTLLRRRRQRRLVVAAQEEVLGFTQALAAELAAGRPAAVALHHAGSELAGLPVVRRGVGLGGDLPGLLRKAAVHPGYSDLRLVAAAWQVSQASGAGMALAMQRIAQGLRASRTTRRLVRAELASARSTARLVAALPLAALMMGRGIGGDPFDFLLGTLAGQVCLVAGLLLLWAGLRWIEALADEVESP